MRTLVLICAVAALSPFLADLARRFLRVPGVVVEIALGIAIGPQVLGWAHLDEVIEALTLADQAEKLKEFGEQA